MDKANEIFEEKICITEEESEENLPEPIVIPEAEEEISDETSEEHKRESHGFFRLISGILSLIFCTATAAVYISGAASIAAKTLGAGVENILTNEVFEVSENPSYKTEEPDLPPAGEDAPSDSGTQNSGDTAQPDDPPAPIIFPSLRVDLSAAQDKIYTLSNETSFSPDVGSLLKLGNRNMTCDEIYKKYGSDAPVVLIVHTHGTEAYSKSEDTYSSDETFRSNDISENVVSVGDTMAKVFEAAGINVIHDTEMYDMESYKDSYSRSYAAVKTWLEKYPSITYVFDVHRDAIIRDDKTKICPVGDYNGCEIAQMMLVVGTNEGGADHEAWEENLSFALEAQQNLIKNSGQLARMINLRSAAFNQGLSKGSLLLEIGSCGNTLPQAKRCSVLTAIALSETITGKACSLSPEDFFKDIG